MDDVLGIVGIGALLALLLLATLAFLTFTLRGTPVRRVRAIHGSIPANERADGVSPVPVTSETFCELAKVLCKTALADGHSVRCFFTGDGLFASLLDDLRAAESLITWHVYWFKPGRVADDVGEVLAERARSGVRVLMLLDHHGSKGTDDGYVRALRNAGVEVAIFRPPRWNALYKVQNRMHIRTVVVDGRVGYTGGFGVGDEWRGEGGRRGEWRDTSVRVVGPAVDQLQGAFAANWGEATGDLLVGDRVFTLGCDGPANGPHMAGLMYSSPSLGSTSAERFFFTSIAAARERCWLSTAYFVPDRYFRQLLREAARRGVDVRVLTPGGNTDQPSTWYAAREHYESMIADGVRIYEYEPSMMHAKSLIVDGVWSMIGTLNFDNRSMVLNEEVALLVWDRTIGRELEAAFEEDLRVSRELDLESVRARPRVPDRVLEWAAGRVSRLM